MKKYILFTCAGYGGGVAKMLQFVMKESLKEFQQVSLLHRGCERENDIIPSGVNNIYLPIEEKPSLIPTWRINYILKIRKKNKTRKTKYHLLFWNRNICNDCIR